MFVLGDPYVFWLREGLFIGLEMKLVFRHNFLPVGIPLMSQTINWFISIKSID